MTTATITPKVAEITDAKERHARAAWSIITEPGDGHAGALVQQLGHVAALAALEGKRADLDKIVPGLAAQAQRWMPRLRTDAIATALRKAEDNGIRLVDPATVPGLADLGPHTPHVLWVRGDIDALGAERRLAIAGARAATSYGESVCADITGDVVAAGVTVHSGGAYGIDGAAHRAALMSDGATVAWLAGGVDRMYPIGHAQLADRIASSAGSALVSEVAPGSSPTRWRFLSRNRLLAAATQATVIVEAGFRSGSLNTAGHAASLGRPLGAVPGNVTSVIYGLSSARALFLRDLPVNDVKDSSPRSVLRSIRRASKAS
ncbi:DNA-protecting protein DprA, partial [Microbacterium aerolatum]|uniref:DNA-processing protein DprA n=1 Tax=Microbacterium aerolatum TaxID=153731 RepID=UPI0020013B43